MGHHQNNETFIVANSILGHFVKCINENVLVLFLYCYLLSFRCKTDTASHTHIQHTNKLILKVRELMYTFRVCTVIVVLLIISNEVKLGVRVMSSRTVHTTHTTHAQHKRKHRTKSRFTSLF